MKKIYKLKSWYSLSDAAKRLTLTLGEDVTPNEVLELALDGHIELYWYTRHVDAQEVDFSKRKMRIPKSGLLRLGEKATEENSDLVELWNFHPKEDQSNISKLSGPYRLLLKACGALEDHFRSHLTNNFTELMSLDGFFIEDGQKRLWQTLEMFEGEDVERWHGKDVGIFDRRRYFPSVSWPEVTEVGFTRDEIELFEIKLKSNDATEIQSRERSTLYKLLIGMAIDGYGYNPDAAKSPFPKELEGVLDRLGISVSDDTIRKKLKEASELLTQDLGG